MTIQSKEAIQNARKNNWPLKEENGCQMIEAPGGYKFYLIDEPQPTDTGKVSLTAKFTVLRTVSVF